MTTHPPSRLARLQSSAGTASWIAGIVGMLVLVGWAWDVDTLKRVFPGLVSMNPMTAVLFVLAGCSLWWQRRPPPNTAPASPLSAHRLARFSALLVLGVGLLKLGTYLFGWKFGVDQILFAGKLELDAPPIPNRMSPNTALDFVFLGLALLLLDVTTRRGRRPSEWLAAAVTLIAFLALVGYAYHVRQLHAVAMFIPMAAHTAAAFLLLALGIFCARPNLGWTGALTNDGPGSRLARRLLPATVFILLALGWLHLEGERLGFYGAAQGVALFFLTNITLFGALILWNARSFNRSDDERQRVELERQRFFALSHDMLCVVGNDGFFKSVNPAWERTLGFTSQELLAKPFMEFVHPDDRQATAHAEEAALVAELLSFENRYACKDGSYRWFQWSTSPVPEEGLIYATARDVTDNKQAEQSIRDLNADLCTNAAQLEQSNHDLEAFTYTVSHDLRAPLRHMDGYARMLAEDAGDQLQPDSKRYLQTIIASARRMGMLIDDLLAFSRLGRKPLTRRQVDMQELVTRSVDEIRAGANANPAARIEVAPLPPAEGDPALLMQVWTNLIGNAFKYSARLGEQARIEVAGERRGERLHYWVRDNGVGFDMRYVDKLFGVFQRLHAQDQFEGTGVGLAIVQRIVHRHGGQISVVAEPDRGACFTFDLPAGEAMA